MSEEKLTCNISQKTQTDEEISKQIWLDCPYTACWANMNIRQLLEENIKQDAEIAALKARIKELEKKQ